MPRTSLAGGNRRMADALCTSSTEHYDVYAKRLLHLLNYSRVDFSLLGVQGKEITSPKLIVEVSLLETKTVLVTQSGVIPISTN